MVPNRVLLLCAVLGVLVACSKAEPKKMAVNAAPPTAPVAQPAAAKPGTKPAAKGGALMLGVPEAHLPPAGQCRIWKAGVSAFKQPQSRSCDGIQKNAPAGSMILERPSKDPKIVKVRYIDPHKAGKVVKKREFEAATGKYIKDD